MPPSGSWASERVLDPRVIYDPRIVDGTGYRMWFVGAKPGGGEHIGYAFSGDGLRWTILSTSANPVLRPGRNAWDNSSVEVGSVIRVGASYLMWYRGIGPGNPNGAFGLATSNDGIGWTKYPGNPVMLPNTTDGFNYGRWPYVIKDGSTYKMWYAGKTSVSWGPVALYATSTDGMNWVPYSSPVLSPSYNPSVWDSSGVVNPTVYFDGSTYWMWYTGWGGNPSIYGIGYATSKDGISWTKGSDNPIVTPGPSGSWDGYGLVGYQDVLIVNGLVRLYYSASQRTPNGAVSYMIGAAQSPSGFPIPEFPLPSIGVLLIILAVVSSVASKRVSGTKTNLSNKRQSSS